MGYGSTLFNLQRPTVIPRRAREGVRELVPQCSAVQVAFERLILKPGFLT
jgi:hypothetical protein